MAVRTMTTPSSNTSSSPSSSSTSGYTTPNNKQRKRFQNKTSTTTTTTTTNDKDSTATNAATGDKTAKDEILKNEYLPPLVLVLTVLLCSGFMWIISFRDLMATGKSIFGELDDALLQFTKSTKWFDDTHGWKSQQGGFSAIQPHTTDENDMGGFFVRKVGGAAGLAVQSQKLMPFLWHPSGARWNAGHFRPLLICAILGNLFVAGLWWSWRGVMGSGDGVGAAEVVVGVSLYEALIMMFFLLKSKKVASKVTTALPPGKTPSSITSRIVMRTVAIVSTSMSIIAFRDLFFPGHILKYLPRDDIYLEWTGAFLHSPPSNAPEYSDHILAAPLYSGDLFVSQCMALYILIGCLYKYATAFFIRWGQNNSGEISCRMIWKVQSLGMGLIVFVFRLFAQASLSASLDLRWHLMCMAYEGFILGLHGFM